MYSNENRVLKKEMHILEEDKLRHLELNAKEKSELEIEIEHLSDLQN